ncbi:MAG: DUF167 domain-containing protein [bacterium]|nr:DUF167 domain-containing protein [bacterium]
MKISVKVKTKARKEGVEEISENQFKISVKEPPEKGKANERVIELLSEFFKTAKSNIEIVSGATSKHKIVEIKK